MRKRSMLHISDGFGESVIARVASGFGDFIPLDTDPHRALAEPITVGVQRRDFPLYFPDEIDPVLLELTGIAVKRTYVRGQRLLIHDRMYSCLMYGCVETPEQAAQMFADDDVRRLAWYKSGKQNIPGLRRMNYICALVDRAAIVAVDPDFDPQVIWGLPAWVIEPPTLTLVAGGLSHSEPFPLHLSR